MRRVGRKSKAHSRRIDEAGAEFNSSATRRISAVEEIRDQNLVSIEARWQRRAGEARKLVQPRREPSKIAPARLAEGSDRDGR